MPLTEFEIREGLKQTGIAKIQAENELYKLSMHLIPTTQKKFPNLDEDERCMAYSDVVINTIRNVVEVKVEGRSSLKTYMHAAFYNKCVDMLRNKSSNKNVV